MGSRIAMEAFGDSGERWGACASGGVGGSSSGVTGGDDNCNPNYDDFCDSNNSGGGGGGGLRKFSNSEDSSSGKVLRPQLVHLLARLEHCLWDELGGGPGGVLVGLWWGFSIVSVAKWVSWVELKMPKSGAVLLFRPGGTGARC